MCAAPPLCVLPLLPRHHLQVSLEALWWVVVHNLTPLNYVLALEASIWFIERAAMEHPKHKVGGCCCCCCGGGGGGDFAKTLHNCALWEGFETAPC